MGGPRYTVLLLDTAWSGVDRCTVTLLALPLKRAALRPEDGPPLPLRWDFGSAMCDVTAGMEELRVGVKTGSSMTACFAASVARSAHSAARRLPASITAESEID